MSVSCCGPRFSGYPAKQQQVNFGAQQQRRPVAQPKFGFCGVESVGIGAGICGLCGLLVCGIPIALIMLAKKGGGALVRAGKGIFPGGKKAAEKTVA